MEKPVCVDHIPVVPGNHVVHVDRPGSDTHLKMRESPIEFYILCNYLNDHFWITWIMNLTDHPLQKHLLH